MSWGDWMPGALAQNFIDYLASSSSAAPIEVVNVTNTTCPIVTNSTVNTPTPSGDILNDIVMNSIAEANALLQRVEAEKIAETSEFDVCFNGLGEPSDCSAQVPVTFQLQAKFKSLPQCNASFSVNQQEQLNDQAQALVSDILSLTNSSAALLVQENPSSSFNPVVAGATVLGVATLTAAGIVGKNIVDLINKINQNKMVTQKEVMEITGWDEQKLNNISQDKYALISAVNKLFNANERQRLWENPRTVDFIAKCQLEATKEKHLKQYFENLANPKVTVKIGERSVEMLEHMSKKYDALPDLAKEILEVALKGERTYKRMVNQSEALWQHTFDKASESATKIEQNLAQRKSLNR